MTTQTPSTEERLSRLEGAYEQVSERLGDLRSDVNTLREEMRLGLESLRADIRSFRGNMLLLMGGVWTTMIGGFIAMATLL